MLAEKSTVIKKPETPTEEAGAAFSGRMMANEGGRAR
jgi:hypothetical protein